MARPRKNAAKVQGSLLAPDEVAEIPVEEQPYPLPEGWRWVRLGSTITLHRGVSYKKTDAHSIPSANDCLIMRGGNICEGSIELYTDNVYVDKSLISQDQFIKNLDIIIVTSTGSKNVIGRAGIAFQDYQNVAFGAFLTLARINDGYNKRYISFYFQSDLYRNRIRKLANGVSINNVRSEYITESELPFPPIDEQQRIVDRIESLFAKLDDAKAKAEAVLDSFEIRKAAILHKAFTGELTEKWRNERGTKREDWKNLTLNDVAKWGSGGTPSRKHPEYYKGDIAWVKTGELNNQYLYETEEHITPEAIENSSAKIFPRETVIIAMYGATIGQCAILGIPAATNQACACAVVKSNVYNKFLYHYLASQKNCFINLGKGGAQPNISQTIVKEYPVALPSLPEQREIVRILDSLLAKEQQVRDAAENVLNQIDLMKKAILARAFRGELGSHGSARDSLPNNGSM